MTSLMLMTDGYKLDHRRQYPEGTEYVYSNFTPRSSRVPGQNEVVFFGLQAFLYKFEEESIKFFAMSKEVAVVEYQEFLNSYFGPNSVGTDHIAALHDLGYIPLHFKALPEGTRVPIGVPMFTVENTHPDFFWLTNYFETMISSHMWQAITSATTASIYRRILDAAAKKTGQEGFVDYQAHDFSYRGMPNTEAAATSGAGHSIFFKGTDCLPAIDLINRYYPGDNGMVGVSVPATEHSVMCAGGKESEIETFDRLLTLYPTGTVSVVSDTWDLWYVHTNILPKLKDKIMARDGTLVIRPDSGDPVEILCGYAAKCGAVEPHAKGVVELLWGIFGGTINSKGYKELDPHIGTIYGDSITPERAQKICDRLEQKGFASTNVVLGVGSFTYQHVTRDTYGMAMKATWCQVNGEERMLQKDPVTDSGTKKSARGRLAVLTDQMGKLYLVDGLGKGDLPGDLLQTVWKNGKFVRTQSFANIRKMANG